MTDANPDWLSRLLPQSEKQGQRRPIALASQVLRKFWEISHARKEKEDTELVYSLHKWREYLHENSVT